MSIRKESIVFRLLSVLSFAAGIFSIGLLVGIDIVRETAVEKGAAVYRVKPGTVRDIEFVWIADVEKGQP